MPDTLERDLLDQFVQGDQRAFEWLFRHHESDVYRWIVRIIRDASAAEDVLVEAFWRAYRGRACFDSSRSFGAWMRRIATNAALDHLKVARRHASWSATDSVIAAPAVPDSALTESVALAFRRLSPKLQIVATLALVEGRPYADIADALDVPIGTVKSRVFRAIRTMRKELAGQGIRP